jgi:hypothetical protein
MPRKAAARPEPLEPLIRNIRGERVILDSDPARGFGVEARAINQALKRSAERFPVDFTFQPTVAEATNLKSQIVTSSLQGTDNENLGRNSSQTVTTSHGGARKRPWAFTEHGALMATNVLRSERAVQMSVYVVRAFISQRGQLAAKADVLRRMEKMDEKLMEHDEALLIVWGKIKELMQPAVRTPLPSPPQRQI